jgi:hypothetical protein
MAKLRQLAGPMMRATASFHTNQARAILEKNGSNCARLNHQGDEK